VTTTEVGSVGPVTEDDAWPPALVAVYGEQRLALVRLAYLIVGDREQAEEIVHDAFVSTYAAWDRVREPIAYVRTSVVNRSRGVLRRRRLERRHAEPTTDTTSTAPDELWDVLDRLRPRQRAALVLRFYDGLPDAEIAELLGCRATTVRTTIHRALAALRKEIEK
jgi:RNA polymerase sigma-70 factor (sigma-E family)